MPKAPEEAFSAAGFQPLSLVHRESRQLNWSAEKPNFGISVRAMSLGSAALSLTLSVTAGPPRTDSAAFLAGSAAVRRSVDDRDTTWRRSAAAASAAAWAAGAAGEVTREPRSSAALVTP